VRLAVPAGHRGGVRAVAFSPDGTTAATASLDNTASLWRIADRSAPVRLDALAGDSQALRRLAFSPDAKTLATSSSDGAMTLPNVAGHAQPVSLSWLAGHDRGSNTPILACRPNGRVLASGGWDARTILWNAANPACALRCPLCRRQQCPGSAVPGS
jgi:WD40 repeat protein